MFLDLFTENRVAPGAAVAGPARVSHIVGFQEPAEGAVAAEDPG